MSSSTKARSKPSSPCASRKSRDSNWRSPAAKPRASAAFSHPPAAPASIAFATRTTFLSKCARNRQTRKEAPAARTWPATLRVGAAESNSHARGDAATESTSRAPISTVWWYSSGWMYPVPSTAHSARRMTKQTYVVSSAPTDQAVFVKRDSPRDDRRRRLFRAEESFSPLDELFERRRETETVSSSSVSASRFSRSTPPYTTRLRTVGLAMALARTLRGWYGFE